MLIRRKALGNRPILNPDYFMYSEEKDLSLRLRLAGWYTWFVPSAEIIHYGGRSTGLMPASMYLELQKSQIKYYFWHYSQTFALALCLSWWLILCSRTSSASAHFIEKETEQDAPVFAGCNQVSPVCCQLFLRRMVTRSPIERMRRFLRFVANLLCAFRCRLLMFCGEMPHGSIVAEIPASVFRALI